MVFFSEEWVDQYRGEIPYSKYDAQFEISDENGLRIHLISDSYQILLDFGFVYGINILDEGVQLNYLPNCNMNADIMPHTGLLSTLYMVRNGRYLQYIKYCLGQELFDSLNLQQFNVVTQNYNVMIVCQEKPNITIENM